MMTDKQIFDAIRERRGKPLDQADVDAINAILGPPTIAISATVGEPAWITNARSKIGRAEIVGPKHNNWIAAGWARLGVKWFNDDETPWCGYFVADCLNDVGLTYPKNFPSAASFTTYGTACPAQIGAIGVKARKGGNHVFFIVGQTADGIYYKALGGNQGNRVSIIDIRKDQVNFIRWPAGAAMPARPDQKLPILPAGTTSVSEA
jgi:uncharacterized protein (TIGR02594 family)